MKIQDLMNANADRKVSVTYPDGKGNHQATIREISDRFINEGAEWRVLFFNNLLTTGEAMTRFGSTYKLIK